MAVEGVDGGAVVVGEEAGAGEVVGPPGEVGGDGAEDGSEGDRGPGLGALGEEEELVVPVGGRGGVGCWSGRRGRGDWFRDESSGGGGGGSGEGAVSRWAVGVESGHRR